jgi:hypothetical protein
MNPQSDSEDVFTSPLSLFEPGERIEFEGNKVTITCLNQDNAETLFELLRVLNGKEIIIDKT